MNESKINELLAPKGQFISTQRHRLGITKANKLLRPEGAA